MPPDNDERRPLAKDGAQMSIHRDIGSVPPSGVTTLSRQRLSVSVGGHCARPSHTHPRQLCPLHGCAHCCAEDFDELASWYGVDEPPLGPPVGPDGLVVPEWYRDNSPAYDPLDLWEAYVTEGGCQVCSAILWQALPAEQRGELLAVESGLAYCVVCFASQRGIEICCMCRRCREHAGGHCENVATVWSRTQRRKVDVWFEDHQWVGGAA